MVVLLSYSAAFLRLLLLLEVVLVSVVLSVVLVVVAFGLLPVAVLLAVPAVVLEVLLVVVLEGVLVVAAASVVAVVVVSAILLVVLVVVLLRRLLGGFSGLASFALEAPQPWGRQATRKPTKLSRKIGPMPPRDDDRHWRGSLHQQPPRARRSSCLGLPSRLGSGSSQARPSLGPSTGLGCQRSRHHSQSWPCISASPQGLTSPIWPIAVGLWRKTPRRPSPYL